jgi:hypothetical protein
VEIKSADVGVLTSAGLDELKQLINDATVHRAELQSGVATGKRALKRAVGRLWWAESLIVRLFTKELIPRLVDAANKASDELDETKAHLDGCFVEVDFAFDDTTSNTYDALVRSFEALRTAQGIWSITSTAAVDRVTQRTTSSSALTRRSVTFSFASSEIVRSQYRAMRLGTVSGRDLQIYPGFLMMRDAARDFALIEFAQFDCRLAQSNFIEEESVPSDAEQVGSTWKRANKDGSRDRRFNDNYQIPVLRYGGLAFSSPQGLGEVFQISSYGKAADFAHALAAHKRALANLESASHEALALPAPSDDGEIADQHAERAFAAKPRTNLAIDWVVLAMLVVGLGCGGFWAGQHWDQLSKSIAEPPTPEAAAPGAAQPSESTAAATGGPDEASATDGRGARSEASAASGTNGAGVEGSQSQSSEMTGARPNYAAEPTEPGPPPDRWDGTDRENARQAAAAQQPSNEPPY